MNLPFPALSVKKCIIAKVMGLWFCYNETGPLPATATTIAIAFVMFKVELIANPLLVSGLARPRGCKYVVRQSTPRLGGLLAPGVGPRPRRCAAKP